MTSKKVNILGCLLSFILGVGFGIGGYGIADKIRNKQSEPNNLIEATDNDGTVINNAAENGVRLMSEKISPFLYAANGVSETAESAYTITATVLPEDASNKNLTWEFSFKNASSSWAKGKRVTDYVTVSSSGDTNNVAVLSCKKAFGEQILLKAISAADNTKSATVTVDYRQKITNATLHFGDLSVDSGKTLHPEFDLRVWEKGDGGAVSLTYETSDYTIADTFTIDWSNKKGSSLDVGAVGVMNGKVVSEEFLMDVELGEDIYFDLSFFDFPLITEFYINSVAYTSLQAKQNNPFAIRAISYFFKSCKDCGSTDPLAVASLSVPIKSNYSTYTATFSIDFVNYVSGETAVSSVSTNESGVIY